MKTMSQPVNWRGVPPLACQIGRSMQHRWDHYVTLLAAYRDRTENYSTPKSHLMEVSSWLPINRINKQMWRRQTHVSAL